MDCNNILTFQYTKSEIVKKYVTMLISLLHSKYYILGTQFGIFIKNFDQNYDV